MESADKLTALEFFSGIGLARAGMRAAGIDTVWANDIDEVKCELYAAQWGDGYLPMRRVQRGRRRGADRRHSLGIEPVHGPLVGW